MHARMRSDRLLLLLLLLFIKQQAPNQLHHQAAPLVWHARLREVRKSTEHKVLDKPNDERRRLAFASFSVGGFSGCTPLRPRCSAAPCRGCSSCFARLGLLAADDILAGAPMCA